MSDQNKSISDEAKDDDGGSPYHSQNEFSEDSPPSEEEQKHIEYSGIKSGNGSLASGQKR